MNTVYEKEVKLEKLLIEITEHPLSQPYEWEFTVVESKDKETEYRIEKIIDNLDEPIRKTDYIGSLNDCIRRAEDRLIQLRR